MQDSVFYFFPLLSFYRAGLQASSPAARHRARPRLGCPREKESEREAEGTVPQTARVSGPPLAPAFETNTFFFFFFFFFFSFQNRNRACATTREAVTFKCTQQSESLFCRGKRNSKGKKLFFFFPRSRPFRAPWPHSRSLTSPLPARDPASSPSSSSSSRSNYGSAPIQFTHSRAD